MFDFRGGGEGEVRAQRWTRSATICTACSTPTAWSWPSPAAATPRGGDDGPRGTDEGISGAKGRDKRPGYDALLTGVARKDFEMIACWSVDRLGRSLPHLVAFLGDIQAKGVDLFLFQQGLDTSTPSGRAMFGMPGVFAEFERSMIRERILSGLRRTSKKSGRMPVADDRAEAIRRSLKDGEGIRTTARLHKASTTTVTKIAREIIAA